MKIQAKIHCCQCNSDYQVYLQSLQHDSPIHCPNCGAIMDTDMWNMVVNATYAVNDVNNHFQKYHSEREENLFYRRQCPYDAMGDYSVLMENEKNIKAERNAKKSDPGIRRKIK